MRDYYQERKQARIAKFQERFGKKLIKCGACNGSGYYDHNGSPPCAACNGTGKERED